MSVLRLEDLADRSPLSQLRGWTLKILVTGGTGFIGQHLLAVLAENTHEVYCLVRDPMARDSLHLRNHSIVLIAGDLTDPYIYERLPTDIDAVVHLAAILGAWNLDESHVLKNNVIATVNLLNWFTTSGGRQFLFISTPGVQGFGYYRAAETAPYYPRELYEISKMLAEKKVMDQDYRPGQAWTILRPDFVYGPGDMRRIRLYRKIKHRLWVKIGNGESVLRPTFVVDVAQAIYACLGHPGARRRIFNVAGPELVTVGVYANTIARILNVSLPRFRVPIPMMLLAGAFFEFLARMTRMHPFMTRSQVEFLTRNHGTDISNIRWGIGFSPRVGFEEGMRRTLAWALENHLL